MSKHHEALAKQLVERFANSLGTGARAHITAAQLEDLEQSICKLLSHEHDHIADLLEAFVRTLRRGSDKPELEL